MLIALTVRPVSWILQTHRQTDERAIGDCILAKICYYNAHCNGDSENWSIVDYIDVWLVWKSIGLHVLADDANALYPLFTHSTCLVTWWPSYWTFELENWQGSVLSQDSSVYEILWSYVTAFMGKMRQFYLNMNREGQIWRHTVTSSTSKVLFLA